MTMKTLLLGAAAGLVTVGAAQAADLPMTKAEAVEYVRVCTEFGEGFFYIPGTDTCLKIAGEIRADYQFDSRDSRLDDVTAFDTEARLKWDARTATEYGTLRSYVQVHVNYGAVGPEETGVLLDKAFIQWGPITAGKAHSFFGLYDADYANTIFAGYFGAQGDANLLAYTAVFGGGFSATLSVEDGRDHRAGLLFENEIEVGQGVYGGQSMPDIVGNIRLDQSWGKVMLSGAVHEIRYGSGNIAVDDGAGGFESVPVITDIDADYGWAAALGVAVNLPFMTNSYIVVEGTYADGAGDYLTGPNDAIFSTAAGSFGDTDLQKGWSVTGEIGIGFTPALQFVGFASYLDVDSIDAIGDGAFFTADDARQSWVVGANATYTLTPGLTIAAEVSYSQSEFDNIDEDEAELEGFDTEEWAGGVRIKRVF
jgi:opacity protein-like surface antigen